MKHNLSESKQFSLVLIFTALLLLACSLFAGEVKLAWTASPSTNVTAYLLRAAKQTMTTNAPPAVVVNVGTNLTATLVSTNAGRWYVDCRARDALGLQSKSSNELILDIPESPGQLRVVVLQATATLTNGFSDVGFFRVEIR